MKRLKVLAVVVVALSFMYAPTLIAEPASQPGASQKAPAKQPKTKEKDAQPRVEGSYSSEAEAKKACADGAVVWVNSRSRIFHAGGTRDYGKTRQGFYMCQAQAERSGFRGVKGPTQKNKKTNAPKAQDKS
jgi:hypothetical protein